MSNSKSVDASDDVASCFTITVLCFDHDHSVKFSLAYSLAESDAALSDLAFKLTSTLLRGKRLRHPLRDRVCGCLLGLREEPRTPGLKVHLSLYSYCEVGELEMARCE